MIDVISLFEKVISVDGSAYLDSDTVYQVTQEEILEFARLLAQHSHGALTNEGAEPAAWQFYQQGKWWNGDDRIKDHRLNTQAAGIPTRDIFAVIPTPLATCTCPSGDGSLRWPCPVHPPEVEVPEGWKLVPTEPTAAMLSALARREWPADMEAGKRLQRLRGCDVVFPKTEIECAVGQYERMLAAAPEAKP